MSAAELITAAASAGGSAIGAYVGQRVNFAKLIPHMQQFLAAEIPAAVHRALVALGVLK